MEMFKLKMNFRGYCVYVNIEDTDRCLLIDVINDLYDEASKSKFPLPRHPTLAYNFNMKSIELLDDKGLLEMFSRLEGNKEIDIWIGCGLEPSQVLTMARQLRATQESDIVYTEIVPVEKPRNKLEVRRKTMVNPVEKLNTSSICTTKNISSHRFTQTSHTTQITQEMTISPMRSGELINHVTIEATSPISNHVIIPSSSIRRSPKFTQIIQTTRKVSCETQTEPPRFKLSKSTAKLKGVFVPKVKTSAQIQGNSSTMTGTRRKRIEYGEHQGDEDDSDTDGSYILSDHDTLHDEEGCTDLEDEDNTVISTLDRIDDGYDPYKTTEWSVDEEGLYAKMIENGEIYDDKEFGTIKLRPWMLFMDQEHFKDTLKDYCIQEGFHIIVVKGDKYRYTAECASMGCDWRIHASVLIDGTTWAIKSIRNVDHGCVGVDSHNPLANCEWVAKKMLEDIRANLEMSGEDIQKKLMERYGLNMKTSTLYRMREKALRLINGGHDESYAVLPTYMEMIKETNPGSYAICAWSVMDTPEKPLQFKSLFVSFNAQFRGLIEGCRSLIGVDGTHLKGNHGGVLLSAIAVDGNNEIFPVAVGVVEAENKESWSQFFWHLKQVLSESGRDEWTIISDRQKGIEPALDQVWPSSYRRFCARHLCKNFKKDYPGILMHKLFWKIVNAYSEFVFKKTLESLVKHGGNGCGRWFLDLGNQEQWARYRFNPRVSNDENTSNFVESFNSTLGVHRTKPVLSLLEGIRRLSMVRHATRQHVAESWPDDGICPKIRDRLRVLKKDSRMCEAFASSVKAEYEVRDGRTFFPVSLTNRTCKCGQWQITGIPCKHAIRAIITANRDPEAYVSDWFSVAKYKVAYGLSILSIPDSEQWPTLDCPTLEPPTLKRSIGRPSRNRRREPGEQRKGKRSITVKCKKCQCFGHNSRTCKGGLTAKEKQQMKGQTRSSQVIVEQYKSLNEIGEGSQSQSQVGTFDNASKGKKRKTTTTAK